MGLFIQVDNDFPRDCLPSQKDALGLFESREYETLKNLVVSVDRQGNVISRFGDNVWDLSPMLKSLLVEDSSCRFVWGPKAGFPAKPNYLEWRLKVAVYGWLFIDSKKYITTDRSVSSLVANWRHIKNHVVPYLIEEHGSFARLEYLSNQNIFEGWLDHLEEKGLKYNTVRGVLSSVRSLEMNSETAVTLPPFDVNELASRLSVDGGRQTLAIPQRIADELYGFAIRVVQHYLPLADQIEAIERACYEAVDRKTTGDVQQDPDHDATGSVDWADISDICKTISGPDDPLGPIESKFDYQRFNSLIRAACYTCIGAFTGMRHSEIRELTKGAYFTQEHQGKTLHLVRSNTLKLINGKAQKATWVACPVVGQAMELLERITEPTRERFVDYDQQEIVNSLWLSNYSRKSSVPVVSGNSIRSKLVELSRLSGVTITPDDVPEHQKLNGGPEGADLDIGAPWRLAPHQFRRTFAVYAVRHHLGSLSALKQQFKHVCMGMTEWYTNFAKMAAFEDLAQDQELARLINDVNKEITATTIHEWYKQDATLSGGKGEEISGYRGGVPQQYQTWESILDMVEKGMISIHGSLFAYCMSGTQCDMGGTVNPAFCTGCGSSVIDDEKAQAWRTRHQSAVQSCLELHGKGLLSKSRYAHYLTQIRAAERVMSQHGLEFTKFELETNK